MNDDTELKRTIKEQKYKSETALGLEDTVGRGRRWLRRATASANETERSTAVHIKTDYSTLTTE